MIKAGGSLLIHSGTGTEALNLLSAGNRVNELVQDSDLHGDSCPSDETDQVLA